MSETNNINPSSYPNSDLKLVSQIEIGNSTNLDDREQNVAKTIETSQENTQSKNIDWHKIAHKLREHNRKLLKQVFQLEQEVSETNNRIKEHQDRSQSTDLLIAQQAEEINHNQDEIGRFQEEIEVSRHEKKAQQVLIESLTEQLEKANEKINKVEKNCSLLREKFDRQTQDLLIKTQQIQELSTRLSRQQRYTLQYKAALDEYLGGATAGKKSEIKLDNDLLPIYPQPVQAWSQNLKQNKESVTVQASHLGSSGTESDRNIAYNSLDTKLKQNNWPSPVITNNNRQQKPHPLAAVKLPKFQHPETEENY